MAVVRMIEKPETKILGNVVALMIGISLMVVGYTTVLKADTMDHPIYTDDPDNTHLGDNGTIEVNEKIGLSSDMTATLSIGAIAFVVGCIFAITGVYLWINKFDRNQD